MATASGRESAHLSERLQREPYRFDFFQAVRLLERLARDEGNRLPSRPVGADHPPEQECVHFRALPSLSFPTAPVTQIRSQTAAEMAVSFLGLTGVSGVLPPHYTALILRRLRSKDSSLRDWLDVFNHRLVSLFYRAWEKYRLPFAYERARLDQSGREPEKVTQALYSLIGRATAGQRGRQSIPDEVFLFYGGHFAHHPRSAAALEQLLTDYFATPVCVLQLQGHWLYLERDDQARLPSREYPRGRNTRLGEDVVIGERVWGVQNKFRLRVGSLTYRQFLQFLPQMGKRLRLLCQMARAYVGLELTFDVQLVLRVDETPQLRLGAGGEERPYLGWNTWVRSTAFVRDAEEAIFAEEQAAPFPGGPASDRITDSHTSPGEPNGCRQGRRSL
jgi:type VI secretion system protein ImpH